MRAGFSEIRFLAAFGESHQLKTTLGSVSKLKLIVNPSDPVGLFLIRYRSFIVAAIVGVLMSGQSRPAMQSANKAFGHAVRWS